MPPVSSLNPRLPSGYRLLRFDVIDSTNAEARRRAMAGETGPLWIWASRQTAGRGRAGREWRSDSGNLFASLLLTVDCPLQTASQLALLAGVAAFDAIRSLVDESAAARLLLKWPNDVLLASGKIAGVLLENASESGRDRSTVIIGTGINLANHPEDVPQPATNLAAHGGNATPAEALETLARVSDEWLAQWGEGAHFQSIRQAWLKRAGPTGRPLRVRLQDEEAEGLFGGIDAHGALRLILHDGAERRVPAGDVFFAAQ